MKNKKIGNTSSFNIVVLFIHYVSQNLTFDKEAVSSLFSSVFVFPLFYLHACISSSMLYQMLPN